MKSTIFTVLVILSFLLAFTLAAEESSLTAIAPLSDVLLGYSKLDKKNDLFIKRTSFKDIEHVKQLSAVLSAKDSSVDRFVLSNIEDSTDESFFTIFNGLKNSEKIRILAFSKVEFNEKVCEALSSTVKSMSKLEKLYLYGNKLQSQCLKNLLQNGLQNVAVFHKLVLIENELKDDDLKLLIQFINARAKQVQENKEFKPITDLIMRDSKITTEGAKILEEFLSQSPVGFAHLDVSENRAMGDEGFRALLNGVSKSSTLTHFDLAFSDMNSTTAKDIAHVVRKATNNLLKLDFSENNLGLEGAKLIAEAIKENNSTQIVKKIDLSNNQLTADGLEALIEAVKGNPHIKAVHVHRNYSEKKEVNQVLVDLRERLKNDLDFELDKDGNAKFVDSEADDDDDEEPKENEGEEQKEGEEEQDGEDEEAENDEDEEEEDDKTLSQHSFLKGGKVPKHDEL